MKRFYPLFLLMIFAGFLYNEAVQYPHGIVGLTRLNGEGCVCHNIAPALTVNVIISGPDSLAQGSTAEYTITLTGGAGHSAGFNAAARNGLLSVSDTSVKKIDTELTQTSPKVFTNDTVRWKFAYTAPAAIMTDTLYAVGLSADGNGYPSAGDLWNFSSNFPIRVIASIPVELNSFSVTAEEEIPVLRWTTASETNNSGFTVERSRDNQHSWESIALVKGAGTTTESQQYIFRDENSEGSDLAYRLKQIDHNGTFRYYGPVTVQLSSAPLQYLIASNYPNPFNPVTTINYSLPSAGTMSVMIYNSTGSLLHEELFSSSGAATENLAWNAVNNASGVYYIHLSFSGTDGKKLSRTLKSILLK